MNKNDRIGDGAFYELKGLAGIKGIKNPMVIRLPNN
jgi:hypothetical protein